MQEGISFLACAELPAVVVNIMRGGPGLGNIAPSQSDYFQATRGGGHGDYRTIVLAPSTVQEMADLMYPAFDLADQYRMVVLVLGDGVLGQMMEPVELSKKETHRKLPPKDWALTGCAGRRQNIVKSLDLVVPKLEKKNLELQEKFRLIEENEVVCEEHLVGDAEIILVAYGIASRIARTVVSRARKDGIKAGWIRPITLWPFPYNQIGAAADTARLFLSVELSYGQMIDDVKIAVAGKAPVHFTGRSGGAIPTVEQVYDAVKKLMKPKQVAVER
jgi:2-oxoglutarate ferredoxin oxidoreductase subunit alpha